MEDKRNIDGKWESENKYLFYPLAACVIRIIKSTDSFVFFINNTNAWAPNVSATFDHGTFRMFNWIPDDKDIRFRQAIVEHYSETRLR